jgi:hypothetical protein
MQRRLEIMGNIESFGMAEITAEEISLAIDVQHLNVMQIVTLQSTERYCAFLDPRKLAEMIVQFTAPETRDTDMPERIRELITEAFAETNFCVMKMDVLPGGQLQVRMEKGQPRASQPKIIN